jgi:hypothetical protein
VEVSFPFEILNAAMDSRYLRLELDSRRLFLDNVSGESPFFLQVTDACAKACRLIAIGPGYNSYLTETRTWSECGVGEYMSTMTFTTTATVCELKSSKRMLTNHFIELGREF